MWTNLTIAILSALIGVYVGHRLTVAKQSKDDRRNAIDEVVENYVSGKFDKIGYNVPMLLACGAGLLKNTSELLIACDRIVARGKSNPLLWARKHLADEELLPFVRWHHDRVNYRPDDYFNDKAFQGLVARFREKNNVEQ